MNAVQKHYDQHLGPIYLWMAGGLDAGLARGTAEIDGLGLSPRAGDIAVDLGAGFGMHAIPLARTGFDVLAVDSCQILINEIKAMKRKLSLRAVLGELEDFNEHLADHPKLVVCMGDTLTHLENEAALESLVEKVANVMEPGGRFVATFRDYSEPLVAGCRFIPVRADAKRVLTCFLEYSERHVMVYDMLHERIGRGWTFSVSSYRKLRILPDHFQRLLSTRGFSVERSSGPSGMLHFSAILNA